MLIRFLAALLLGVFISIPGYSLAQSDRLAWITNEDMLLFHEAIDKIQQHSIAPEKTDVIIHRAVQGYLKQTDRYSDYLTPEEYDIYKHREASYGGVGMDIFPDNTGQIVCVPFPGLPSDSAGIEYGDLLIGVDGKSVSDKTMFSVMAMLRGSTGKPLTVTVRKKSGETRSISLVRKLINSRTVYVMEPNPLPVLRIVSFSRRTGRELREGLMKVGLSKDKILDLRGNTGGELSEAVEAASLFLAHGSKVVTVRTRSKSTIHLTESKPIDRASKIFIWQDRFSASAAEVFISALKQHRRAVTLGTRTFGKGLCQRFVELSDGSAIFISYGSLLAPNGYGFDRKGFDPDHAVKWQPGDPDAPFVAATKRLMKG